MIGETVSFKTSLGREVVGIVYAYMPDGNDEVKVPFVRVRELRPFLVENGVRKYLIHLVRLDNQSLQVITLDREAGKRLEDDYHAGT